MATSQGQQSPRRITTFQQFVRFSTDASGLERTFRLLQATLHILLSIEPLRQLAITLVSLILTNLPSHSKTIHLSLLSIPTLSHLRSSFALGRRFFRVFRFLESFSSAWTVYTSSGEIDLQSYLDISAKSFNGFYLLLETLHFPEAVLASSSSSEATVWGAEMARTLHVEGQRFWFLALVCGIGCGLVKLGKMWGFSRAVPDEGGGRGKEGESRVEERQRREYARKWRKVGRRVVADVMDLVLPGTVVGWVRVESGTVGLCMLGSTLLTGLEVWERCGGE